MMGKTLIINYRSLSNVGGIEVFVVNLIDFMIKHNVRVIWLQERGSSIHNSFKKVLLNEKVEKVEVSNNLLLWFKYGNFNLNKDDEIVLLSFIVMSKLKAESIVKKYRDCHIKSIYAIPDTKGLSYYIETNFSGILRKMVSFLMRDVHNEWQKNAHLLFFAQKQVDALQDTYGIKINNGYSKVLKSLFGIPPLDYEILRKKCKREKFNIITIGRLDFPHKGYILGLVKSFNRLKTKYPQLTLTIIGDGHSREVLNKEIESYNQNVRADIRLLGTIPNNELSKYLKDAHLNISVAGCVKVGAVCGVVSIPARNYCTGECEVYGYLPENKQMSVSTTPGYAVDSFIEEVVNMSDEEYYALAVKSYRAYKDNEDVNPWFVFDGTKDYKEFIVPKRKLLLLIIINYLMKSKYFLTCRGFNRQQIIKNFLNFR